LPDLFQGEWALGSYSMTALALTNMAFLFPETRDEALSAVGQLIERMQTEDVRRFDTQQWQEDALQTLGGSRGHIAYLGQLNLGLAAWHYLGGDGRYRPLFDRVSQAIARRVQKSPFRNAETYPSEIYPMDNVAALASLELYERFAHNQPSAVVSEWIAYVRQHLLDSETGLLVHSLDMNGQPTQAARGCSTSWCSFFLPIMDPVFAKDQYANMLTHLGDRSLGVWGIREYPRQAAGWGDVDSGPVVFGLGTSATGFAFGGARWQNDTRWLNRLAFTTELVGSSFQWNGQRRYLLCPLVGDAIMLTMRTMTPWDKRFL
jgi:hypothetical protein